MIRTISLALILNFILVASVAAQVQKPTGATKPGTKPGTRPNREISVTETFEPAFKIEPLSRRITGRPSEVIPFEFVIESNDRPAKVEIRPIGLRQENSGQILHDENSAATEHIRLLSPADMQLEPNKPAKIEGVLRIPHSEARHHSFGILVRDIGNAAKNDAGLNADGTPKTQANIQFITQYVLRIDLEIEGVRGDNMQQLNLTTVKMMPFEGRPKVQLTVENPTETTFEFELRTRMRSSPSDRSFKLLKMVMPVRFTMETEERYIGRILGKSKINMEELLPEAIASGSYEVDVELVSENRVQKKATFPITVEAQDFPAQEVLIAQVGQSTQISPAQVELSQQRGGNRRVTVLVKNLGKETNHITLKALGSNDLDMTGVTIQPESFSLAPAGSRKITVSLRSQDTTDEAAIYGKLFVQSKTSDRDHQESRGIPVAILLKKTPSASATLSPLQWDATGRYPGFRTLIKNTSETHMPLNARLSITDETGRRISIPSGFGRWLMPGESSKLEFRLDRVLPPGNYQLRCDVVQEEKPLTIQQTFTVNDYQADLSSK
jgi:hypothetical protein